MPLDPTVDETLRAHDAASEQRRELAAESVAAMAGAGLLRLLVARRVGGPELDLATALKALIEVTEASASAGWVAMVSTAHDLVMGGFPEAAQDEVYADGLDRVFPGSLATTGALTPVAGGWRLSGRWPFASGAAHGAWFVLGTSVREGGSRPVPHHVVVPRADLALDDDWHVLGLRGTGSVTVRAEDAFVPAHRAMNTGVLFRAESPWQAKHATRLYRTPIVAGLAAHLAAVALGIARPALADALGRSGSQGDRYTGARKVDRVGLQMRLAEAEVELRTAALLFDDTLAVLGRIAGGDDSIEARGRAKYQSAYGMELCARCIQRLMAASGARAAFDGSAIQRAFRDINMARSHAIGDLDTAAETHGRLLLGLGPGTHPV
jgi:3-hydroxy-9,10-secoandrosta-1,3,5(10)-triene-9,17-dione monooxygenase